MKFTFLFSMAMVGHITAQMAAPAPSPVMAPSSSVVATGPAPAPTPFDAPAPAPMQAPANMTNMTNTPAPTWPDPPLVWPSSNETSAAVGNDTADAPAPAPAPVPATVNVNMALTVEDPAGFVADPNSQGAVEAGIATIEGVEAADVNATLTVRTGRRLGGHAASGTVDVAAVITADDAAAAGDIQSRIQHGDAALAITIAINELALAAGMNVTVEVTSLTASQPPASGGSTTSPPPGSGESGAFKPAVVSKMVAGLVALFFAF